jgi:Holliday junction resolvase RusA-like endonuclease
MQFIITGKIKPAVRMTRRGKYVKNNAQEYLASKAAIGWQLKEQMRDNGWSMLPETSLQLCVLFTLPMRLNSQDLSNQIKTIEDAAQGIVIVNDRWIDSIRADRELGDEYTALVTIREASDE